MSSRGISQYHLSLAFRGVVLGGGRGPRVGGSARSGRRGHVIQCSGGVCLVVLSLTPVLCSYGVPQGNATVQDTVITGVMAVDFQRLHDVTSSSLRRF